MINKCLLIIIMVFLASSVAADESFEYMKALGLYDNTAPAQRTPLEEMNEIDEFMDGGRRCFDCLDEFDDDYERDLDRYDRDYD